MNTCVKFAAIEPGIGCLEIHRPDALNALNSEVLHQLASCVQESNRRTDLSVVLIRTSGDKAFVAGADIKEMLNFSAQEAFEFSRFGQQIFQSLSDLPQVVIAQVQGFALGGGLELALAADFMIASEKAKFGLPEVGLGLIPGFGGTQRLVGRIGYGRALEWMTSAERYTADVALACGLVNRVVAVSELETSVLTLARSIAAQGPQAVRAAKMCARAALQNVGQVGFEMEANLFGQRFTTGESREGLRAFMEKRKADFRSAGSAEAKR